MVTNPLVFLTKSQLRLCICTYLHIPALSLRQLSLSQGASQQAIIQCWKKSCAYIEHLHVWVGHVLPEISG